MAKGDWKKIGGLWKKEDKDFLSGEIELGGEKHRIFVFPNKKSKPNHPDYTINIPTKELSRNEDEPVF